MAGFTDLVAQAQPALFGGGVAALATSGRTWRWKFVDVNDGAGNPIDLSAVTGTCLVLSESAGPIMATLDFSGGVGEFTVSLDESETAGLQPLKKGKWSLVLDNGTDSVQVWGSANSGFSIVAEA